jgi:hypothetical protein
MLEYPKQFNLKLELNKEWGYDFLSFKYYIKFNKNTEKFLMI